MQSTSTGLLLKLNFSLFRDVMADSINMVQIATLLEPISESTLSLGSELWREANNKLGLALILPYPMFWQTSCGVSDKASKVLILLILVI